MAPHFNKNYINFFYSKISHFIANFFFFNKSRIPIIHSDFLTYLTLFEFFFLYDGQTDRQILQGHLGIVSDSCQKIIISDKN